MRYFILFFLLLFPSSVFAIKPCSYCTPLIVDAYKATHPTFTVDYQDAYTEGSVASTDCNAAAGQIGTYCSSGTSDGCQYSQYNDYTDPSQYRHFFYIVCSDCTDGCAANGSPADGVCDTCDELAACDCSNKGGVDGQVSGDSPPCTYSCKCDEQYNSSQADCAIVPDLIGPDSCTYECNDCPEAASLCTSCEFGGKPMGCNPGGAPVICWCYNDPDDPQGSANSTLPDPDDNPEGDAGPSNPPGGVDPGDGSAPYAGDPGGTGSSPDPDSPNDPDNDPSKCKNCSDVQESCNPSCSFSCVSDSSGCVKSSNCDCHTDPSGDDGANGWIAAVEENTDRSANESEKNNEWNKAMKHNSDEQLEDSDNIAENTRRGVENSKGYFSDPGGGSVFKENDGSSAFVSSSGNSYLKQIAENTAGDEQGTSDVETTGSGTAPSDNTYDSSLEGFDPVTDTFSQDLSNYIASGIPVVSWIRNSGISLSSSSPVLSFSFWGKPIGIDFSEYVTVIDLVGNMLFALTVISGFVMIITRVKY